MIPQGDHERSERKDQRSEYVLPEEYRREEALRLHDNYYMIAPCML
jgi:hypothetical protein